MPKRAADVFVEVGGEGWRRKKDRLQDPLFQQALKDAGITNYKGTASQNVAIQKKLQSGYRPQRMPKPYEQLMDKASYVPYDQNYSTAEASVGDQSLYQGEAVPGDPTLYKPDRPPMPAMGVPPTDAPGDYYGWDPRARYIAEMAKLMVEDNTAGKENNGFRLLDKRSEESKQRLSEWNKLMYNNGYQKSYPWCALTGMCANDAVKDKLTPEEYQAYENVLNPNTATSLNRVEQNPNFKTWDNQVPEFDQSKPQYFMLQMKPGNGQARGHQAQVQWDPYTKKYYYIGGNEEMYGADGKKIPNRQSPGMRQQGINVLEFSPENMVPNPHDKRPITWSQYVPTEPLVPVNGLATK